MYLPHSHEVGSRFYALTNLQLQSCCMGGSLSLSLCIDTQKCFTCFILVSIDGFPAAAVAYILPFIFLLFSRGKLKFTLVVSDSICTRPDIFEFLSFSGMPLNFLGLGAGNGAS